MAENLDRRGEKRLYSCDGTEDPRKGSFMKLGVIVLQKEPWARHAAALRSLGATHLSLDTMEVG